MEAAALLQSIVANHALIGGDKRLGWLATAVFLEIDGASVANATDAADAADDDVYELVMAVASSSSNIGEVAEQLEQLHEPLR